MGRLWLAGSAHQEDRLLGASLEVEIALRTIAVSEGSVVGVAWEVEKTRIVSAVVGRAQT